MKSISEINYEIPIVRENAGVWMANCFSASCRKFGSLQGEGGNWKWGLCNANFEYFMVKKGYFENMYNLLFDQK